MNKFWTVTFLLTALSFASCEYEYDYTYQVKNTTDSEISIQLESHVVDSLYTISPEDIVILFITDHGIEGKNGPYFDDVSADLTSFLVSKNDTLFSTKNYLNNSTWSFNGGVYNAIIIDEEFE